MFCCIKQTYHSRTQVQVQTPILRFSSTKSHKQADQPCKLGSCKSTQWCRVRKATSESGAVLNLQTPMLRVGVIALVVLIRDSSPTHACWLVQLQFTQDCSFAWGILVDIIQSCSKLGHHKLAIGKTFIVPKLPPRYMWSVTQHDCLYLQHPTTN